MNNITDNSISPNKEVESMFNQLGEDNPNRPMIYKKGMKLGDVLASDNYELRDSIDNFIIDNSRIRRV